MESLIWREITSAGGIKISSPKLQTGSDVREIKVTKDYETATYRREWCRKKRPCG